MHWGRRNWDTDLRSGTTSASLSAMRISPAPASDADPAPAWPAPAPGAAPAKHCGGRALAAAAAMAFASCTVSSRLRGGEEPPVGAEGRCGGAARFRCGGTCPNTRGGPSQRGVATKGAGGRAAPEHLGGGLVEPAGGGGRSWLSRRPCAGRVGFGAVAAAAAVVVVVGVVVAAARCGWCCGWRCSGGRDAPPHTSCSAVMGSCAGRCSRGEVGAAQTTLRPKHYHPALTTSTRNPAACTTPGSESSHVHYGTKQIASHRATHPNTSPSWTHRGLGSPAPPPPAARPSAAAPTPAGPHTRP